MLKSCLEFNLYLVPLKINQTEKEVKMHKDRIEIWEKRIEEIKKNLKKACIVNGIQKEHLINEWEEILHCLEKMLIPLIDEVSEAINKTDDAYYLKNLHFIYGIAYRINMEMHCYRIEKLVERLNLLENEKNDFQKRERLFSRRNDKDLVDCSPGVNPHTRFTQVHRSINSSYSRQIPTIPWSPGE